MFKCASCAKKTSSETPQPNIEVKFTPSPPMTGKAEIALSVSDSSGHPLAVANIQVEGNMNHAGMRPSFATIRELAPGSYAGTMEFTMGGDWFLLITGELPGSHHLEKRIDVLGVKPRE